MSDDDWVAQRAAALDYRRRHGYYSDNGNRQKAGSAADGHGLLRYKAGCRCDTCRKANAVAGRRYRARQRTP